MNSSLNNIKQRLALLQQSAKTNWDIFFFTPERYWRIALSICALLLLVILSVDAILFWRFGLLPGQAHREPTSRYLTLERGLLEHALLMLQNRETRFQQNKEMPPLRNIFAPPSAQ